MQPYSRFGGTRRCFFEFQKLVDCTTSSDTTSKKQCLPKFEDYNECLHGLKEREQVRILNKQLSENVANDKGINPRELYNGVQIYENLDLIKKN
ncbi:uncharacterized protein KGF55_000497 [Candida pseudojiufengensis]|uniref:uncharacterized protein n=1 Tax=Candida pseudojiufengensis TaxID=497109 RepID=UPI00222493C3|nr:uncharacterized protein KGF55_000497 [Candida pseudojiufengensis]KAI5966188.1 hypothetical protein KGF55_000497 [Candida pseudojiufengensis]